jgi:hypothetical protein
LLLRLHIAAACFWVGMIVVETLIELMARKGTKQELQFVVRAHRIVDTYFEAPIVAVVLLTGSVLLYQVWPKISLLLGVKVIAGLLAVVVNVRCIYFVLARAGAKDEAAFQGWQAKVLGVGPYIPIVFLALLIGLYGV